MRKVSIYELTPGMRIGIDIYNTQNQLLVPKNTLLTDEVIQRIQGYSIPYMRISVLDEETENEYPDAVNSITEADPSLSYNDRLKTTRSFQKFKDDFLKNAAVIESSFNDMVTKNMPVDTNSLLEKTESVVSQANGFSIFDMLQNMREYDDSTYVHCLNVALICNVMAKWLNFSKKDTDTLVLAGMLHDVGKLAIPDSIIKKPGKLTKEEYEIIKSHPRKGFDILAKQKLPKAVKLTALLHHERCDGSGYPYGFTYEKIDRFARLISIADVYDAMTADRVYRDALSPFTVVDIFQKEGLQKYAPEYILVFLEHIVDTYVNNKVLLSDGRTGEIVLINKQHLSRPLVRLDDNDFLDLTAYKEIMIDKIL
ncbi:MAG: HD-GYP domain-containing protein [Lachnospiraceae bacterium]|nr:HD-GYP domain-containing protein [Lachnospiraceae bacterium]